ncbi:hypothetical protein I2483_02665 [Sporosarcina sp. E16_3]|uniref:hypothetical protein n=1 Tax=Sporosarcina sp. E16_3 TaxID=2789293 RepID=UPI001A91F79A|nr:hypothetical protein [Sporosarcina sp. E16_3]MBO0600556.1 hypothetical protein [Sporosarcina sp. E16_3]
MIYVKGIVSFLSNKKLPKSKTYMKNKFVSMKIIEVTKRFSTTGEEYVVITCNFTVSMDEDYACKSLEDYNGKVKPFLQKYIKSLIYRVEIHHLNYLRNTEMKSTSRMSSY